jgi:PAS domain S-box-containing protein
MDANRILETLAEGVIALDREGRFTYANPSAGRMLGLAVEEILRRRHDDPAWRYSNAAGESLGEDDLPFSRVRRRKEKLCSEEIGIERPGGSRILVSLNMTPILDAAGEVAEVVAAFSDITAADALRRSGARFRLLFANMNEAVARDRLVFDAKGRPVDWTVTEVNPAYERILGISREQAVGHLASELYAGDFIFETVLQTFSRVALSGVSARLEIHFHRAGCHLLTSVFSLGNGEFATVSMDITERKRAEQEQERLLAELDATISAIADAVVIYHPDGTILRMNPAAERMLCYRPEDWEKPLRERTTELQLEAPDGSPVDVVAIMTRVLGGEVITGRLLKLRGPNRSHRWISASAAPIRTAEGELLGIVGTASDVTSLRSLQEQRDLYIHTISHDLRIPLTVITGHAFLLAEGLEQESGKEALHLSLKEIQKAIGRMTRMIEDLVDSARLEGGDIPLQRQPCSLAAVLAGIPHSPGSNLMGERLELDVPAGLPAIWADPERLERILLNLISNAFKYSPAESPVTVRARQRDAEVEVAVSDAGPGIAHADQPHIFERFYRPAGLRRSDSVGLGLYITRMLVEAHGGRIWVKSEPGEGSTFLFTLPCASS